MRHYHLLLALGLAVAVPVKAQVQESGTEETGVRFLAGLGIQSVDNIYGSATDPVSDSITTETVGASLNAGYSRQRLRLDAAFTNNQYQSHSDLNFQGRNMSGAWQWASGAGLIGSVSLSQVVTENPATSSVDATQRNLNKTQTNQAFVGYDFAGGWQAIVGVVDALVSNERAVVGQSDFRYHGVYAGATYTFSSGNTLGFKSLDASGSNIYDYSLRSNEIKVEIKPDDALILTGVLADFRQSYASHPEYDFSGPTGSGSMKWQITGKTSLAASYQRQLYAMPFITSIYTVNDSLILAPVWQVTSKVALKGQLVDTVVRFEGDPGGGASGEADHIITLMVGVDWLPRENILLTLGVTRTSRTRNLDDSYLRVQRVSLAGTIRF